MDIATARNPDKEEEEHVEQSSNVSTLLHFVYYPMYSRKRTLSACRGHQLLGSSLN